MHNPEKKSNKELMSIIDDLITGSLNMAEANKALVKNNLALLELSFERSSPYPQIISLKDLFSQQNKLLINLQQQSRTANRILERLDNRKELGVVALTRVLKNYN